MGDFASCQKPKFLARFWSFYTRDTLSSSRRLKFLVPKCLFIS